MKRMFLVGAAVALLVAPTYADAKSNIESIANSLDSAGMEWETEGASFCPIEDFCSIYVGDILVQAVAGTVDVMPTNLGPVDVYLVTCAVTLAGLTGDPVSKSIDDVGLAVASATVGRLRHDFGNVRLTMARDSGGELTCSFVVA